MATFRVKLHDTTLPLTVDTDLTGASVKAFIRSARAEGEVPAVVPVNVTDPVVGAFDLVLSEVGSGEFDLEVLVEKGGEQVRTPSVGFDRLVIGPNLDDPLAAPYVPSATLEQVIEEKFAGQADRLIPFAETAQEAAADAGVFAAATEFDANRAGESAFQSGQSAGYALGHRNAAATSAETATVAAGTAQAAAAAVAAIDPASKAQLRGLVDVLNPLPASYMSDALAPPSSNDTPTITWTQSSATTIPGGSTVGYNVTRTAGAGTPADIANDPVFRFDGMLSLPADSADPNNYVRTPLLTGGTAQAARYLLRFGVQTSSTQYVEFRLRPLATTVKFRVIVNGKFVSDQLDARTATVGSPYQLLLTFPTAAVRTVWVEMDGADASLGQARVTAGASLTKAAAPKLRVAVVGDSYTGGSGAPTDGARRLETAPRYIAHLMGAESFFNFGIGGTGWIAGSGSGSNFGTRMADVVACAPDVVIVLGSRNDGSDTGVQAAATAGLAALAPVPFVYVSGPSTSGFTTANAQVKAAATANGRPFFDGIAGAWITSADLGADAVHPTFAGHKKIADGFWRANRPWFLTRAL